MNQTRTEYVIAFDLATAIAHEIHDQAELHNQVLHKERNAKLFRERYAELIPHEGGGSNG